MNMQMLSKIKKIRTTAVYLTLMLCSLSVYAADSSTTNKKSEPLIELMDVMLEDFLNPQKVPDEVISVPPKTKAPVAQAEQDPAESIEQPAVVTQLPQTAEPPAPEHIPIVEQYITIAPEETEQPAPAVSEKTEKTVAEEKPTAVATVEKEQTPVPAKKEPAAVATVTEEKEEEPLQPIPEDSEEVGITIEELEEENEIFDPLMMPEEITDPFEKANTIAMNVEYNSYNTTFKNIGFSFAFEHAIRHNASIGFIAGGFYDLNVPLKTGNLSKMIFEGEFALTYRQYFMTDAMKEQRAYPFGFYVQPELGIALGYSKSTGLIKDQLNLMPSPLIALRTGYRGYILNSPLYVEPYLRVGYPFVAGGGVGIGLKL